MMSLQSSKRTSPRRSPSLLPAPPFLIPLPHLCFSLQFLPPRVCSNCTPWVFTPSWRKCLDPFRGLPERVVCFVFKIAIHSLGDSHRPVFPRVHGPPPTLPRAQPLKSANLLLAARVLGNLCCHESKNLDATLSSQTNCDLVFGQLTILDTLARRSSLKKDQLGGDPSSRSRARGPLFGNRPLWSSWLLQH